ncbi:MAG TPA: hypothetical protein PK297_07885 [Spirochaetota bacterium]|nr:hypothetical protein [Spirochaetota bacterium]
MKEFELAGLRGDNPLAFMAALGALVTCGDGARLAWRLAGSGWIACLAVPDEIAGSEDELTKHITSFLCRKNDPTVFDDVIGTAQDVFLAFLQRVTALASPDERRSVDIAASFGCERAYDHKDGKIEVSRFSKQNGNSGKKMLKDIQTVRDSLDESKVFRSLFKTWDYADEKGSLGWDPEDVRSYAYMASDPGGEPSRTMHGANALAYEALVLYPTAIDARARLATAGTARFGKKACFSWPLWEMPLSLSVVRSLVLHPEIHTEHPDAAIVRGLGIVTIYRSEHFTVEKSQRFRPAVPV